MLALGNLHDLSALVKSFNPNHHERLQSLPLHSANEDNYGCDSLPQ